MRLLAFAFASENGGHHVLASASEDGTVRIWNVEAMIDAGSEELPRVIGQLELVLDDHEDWVGAVAFSPDRNLLASAGEDGTIRLWEWQPGALTRQPQHSHVLTGHLGAVTALAFSPDGKTLASGGVDNTVRLWDPLEGHLRLTLPGHLDAVRSVAFLSADDASQPPGLASLSKDGALKFWLAATVEADPSSEDERLDMARSR
jgi:WD40 repeat protein